MQVLWLGSLVAAALLVGGCSEELLKGNDLPVRCLDEPKAGPCRAHMLGYFYDYRYDKCRPFHYGGCRGHVPFETLTACEETCVANGQ
jgi:hypothetical protein